MNCRKKTRSEITRWSNIWPSTTRLGGRGDAVNVASRLASQAEAGELILSESAVASSGIDADNLERRTLELKGKNEPMDVWVMTVRP
jgi:class 3 adenylate cyclase